MCRVLVVEDEGLIRMTILDALEDAGFDVIEAASADEAMNILNKRADRVDGDAAHENDFRDAGQKRADAEIEGTGNDKSDQKIHFLFTDIQMPGTLSGIDLAHAMAKRFPDAGIIVASGRLAAADVDLPPQAEFHSKPYSLKMIVDRLNAMSNK